MAPIESSASAMRKPPPEGGFTRKVSSRMACKYLRIQMNLTGIPTKKGATLSDIIIRQPEAEATYGIVDFPWGKNMA